jgi:hypothetical protein
LINKKSSYLALIFSLIFLFFTVEILYINTTMGMTQSESAMKKKFVSLIGLPDLAINSNVHYLRHRTLSSVGSIYREDGTLSEYSNGSFSIANGVTK